MVPTTRIPLQDAVELQKRGFTTRVMTWRALSISPYGTYPTDFVGTSNLVAAVKEGAYTRPLFWLEVSTFVCQLGGLLVRDENGSG